ncbi:HAMP domain-containing sensor histidine kinase [Acuticoccus sediminis]|nr:ATP-binding protein [Acuticoccus sediminis]
MRAPLSLGSRIALIIFAAMVAAWLGNVAYYYASQRPAREPALLAPERLAAIVALYETGENRAALGDALHTSGLEIDIESAPLRPGGTTPPEDAEPMRLPDGRTATVTPVASTGRLVNRLTRTRQGYRFQIGLRTGETLVITAHNPSSLNYAGLPVGIVAGLIGTLIALASLVIMHREMAPLRRLAEAADAIDLSGSSPPLPQSRSSAPEIRSLVAAFNRLQARLATLVASRMVMVAGISHDVRTFATRLRLRLEQLPDSETRDRAVRDVIDIVAMLDDAIVATRAGVGELSEELLTFADLVREEVGGRGELGAPVTLVVADDATDASVLGDRLALKRMIANLVDNAVKYGARAHVSLTAAPGSVVFTVDDEGPGIAESDRALLLEPFVRLEASRNRATGGAGLGLAIVKGLVEAHGGSITVGDAPGKGARFVLTLPTFSL